MSLHSALQRDWSSHLQAFVSWVFALQSTMICTEKSVHANSLSWSLCLYLLWKLTRGKHKETLKCSEQNSSLISCNVTALQRDWCSHLQTFVSLLCSLQCKQCMPMPTLKTHMRKEMQLAEFQSNRLQCHCTSVGVMFPSPNLCLSALQSIVLYMETLFSVTLCELHIYPHYNALAAFILLAGIRLFNSKD